MDDREPKDSKAIVRQMDASLESDSLAGKITSFLARELGRAENQTAIKLELRPNSAETRGEPIETWLRESDPEVFGKLTHVEALTRKVVELMEDYTDSADCACSFELRVRRYDATTAYRTFRILPRQRPSDDRDLLLPHETPTGTGLLAQTMRHNETVIRLLESNQKQTAALQEGYLKSMLQFLKEQREENAALRAERSARLVELEEARSQEAERDQAAVAQAASDRRKDVMVNKFAMVLPALANAIAGHMTRPKAGSTGSGSETGSGSNSASVSTSGKSPVRTELEAVLMRFLSSADDRLIAEIKALLGPEQQLVLHSIIDAAERGGSAFLSTMVNDFIGSFVGEQLGVLMGKLSPDQRAMLMEAMKLARASAPGG